MESFIHDDFLLQSWTARELFHTFAEDQPIIDYHCHLSPQEIAEDRKFENLTQIWLNGDHYKWRAMRANGVDKRYCTGDAPDWEKFLAWSRTVPKTLRNPLYHWTHMELRRPFGITGKLLNEDTARGIWEDCNAKLALPEFSTQGIIKQMNVRLVCTTDDPTDDLRFHQALRRQSQFTTRIVPAFRPDKGMAIESGEAFTAWVQKLSEAADVSISSFSSYIAAIRKRHDFFHEMGCRVSDHGIETAYAEDYSDAQVRDIFDRALRGRAVETADVLRFKSAMLFEFGILDHEKGWVQQYHLGALRNINTRMFRSLGPDTGFDTIGDFDICRPLAKLLDRLDRENRLAKTILYNLNPRDNELMAAMIGNFQDGSAAGKIQYGSAWWFLDQLNGMARQIDALSNMGLLSRLIGMLTDSRSFLSYTRHEYFRRLLCNILGGEMETGLLPADVELVGGMVADICYGNARTYFGFDLE